MRVRHGVRRLARIAAGRNAGPGRAVRNYRSGLPACDGADGSTIYQTVAKPALTIGGVAAQVLFSGLAPGFAGLYKINTQVPAGVAAGDEVVVKISMPNGATDSATIAVAQ